MDTIDLVLWGSLILTVVGMVVYAAWSVFYIPGNTSEYVEAEGDPDQDEEPEADQPATDGDQDQQQQPESWRDKGHGDHVVIGGKLYFLTRRIIRPEDKKPDWLLPWWQRSDYQHQVAWRKKLDEEWRQVCEWHKIGIMLYVAYSQLDGWCTYRNLTDRFNGSVVQFNPPEGFYQYLTASKPYTYSYRFIQDSMAYVEGMTFELCEYNKLNHVYQHKNYWTIGDDIGEFTVEKYPFKGGWARKVIKHNRVV